VHISERITYFEGGVVMGVFIKRKEKEWDYGADDQRILT